MDDPVFTKGPDPSQFASGAIRRIVSANEVELDLENDQLLHDDQFRNGRITLMDLSDNQLKVATIVDQTSHVIEIDDTVPAASRRFADLMDDDVANNSANKITRSLDMQIDTRLWEQKMRPALVLPIAFHSQVTRHNNIVPFTSHLAGISFDTNADGAVVEALTTLIGQHKATRSEPGFWVVYQLGAFQSHVEQARDPDDDSGAAGGVTIAVDSANAGNAGSAVFAETLRDLSEGAARPAFVLWRQLTSIHEAGHQFGLEDQDSHGTLMGATLGGDSHILNAETQADADALAFSGAALRRIMTTTQPGHR
jgi:hypothetical protein